MTNYQIENWHTSLNPSLAERNPKQFKKIVLELMGEETKFGSTIWNKLCERRQTNSDKIRLDPSTWVSGSHATSGEITLGAGMWSEELSKQLIFEDWNFQGPKQYVYRITHELAHLTAPKLLGVFNYQGHISHEGAENLTSAFRDMRRSGKGISALGSLEHYAKKGPETQAMEDYTELVNMYSIDPVYLRRYLNFLTNSQYSSIRTKNKLIKLDTNSANHIYSIIKDSMKFFIDNYNETATR